MINFAQYIPMFFLNTSSKLKIFNRISNANIINTPLTFEYNIIAVLSKKSHAHQYTPTLRINFTQHLFSPLRRPSSRARILAVNGRRDVRRAPTDVSYAPRTLARAFVPVRRTIFSCRPIVIFVNDRPVFIRV